jgi:autotransporter-associated beta strand protein
MKTTGMAAGFTACMAVLLALGLASIVNADTITWTGGDGAAPTDFEDADNWSGATTPPTDDTATDVALFDSTTTPSNQTPTLTTGRSIGGLKFQNGGWALGTSANTLTLGKGNATDGQYGIRNVAGNNTVSAKIDIGTNQVWRVDANTLTVSGAISSTGGAYGITKNGGGALTLSGNNSYTGGTTLSGGTLTLSGVNNFSGAGFTVTSCTLQFANANNLGGNYAPVHMNGGTL